MSLDLFQCATREQWILGVATGCALLVIVILGLPWNGFMGWILEKAGGIGGRDGIRIGGVTLTNDARVRHTHIVGATGSGKTVLIEQLLLEDLKRGYGCLVIDPKGDRELFERVRWECRKLGRENDLKLLSATFEEESSFWNPCGLGNISELQSKFFNSAVYSEPHYAKWCERALLQAFNRLVPGSKAGFTITEVVQELERFCRELKSRDEKIEGLFLDFYNLAYGEWGPILGCSREGRKKSEVRLLETTQKNQILFVDLPTEAKKVQSARIGRLLTQELMLISGLRKIYPGIRSPQPFSVYIDEFDAFATESFATFLNKARSSGFMIHIAHQTLSDLNRISHDFAGQILGNCNVRFIFRQDDPDDAERWSRFLGTRSAVKRTYQMEAGRETGLTSNREVQEFVISPDQIKRLKVGEAVVSIKTENRAKVIRTRFAPSAVGTDESGFATRTPESRAAGGAKKELGELSPNLQSQGGNEEIDPWSNAGILKSEIQGRNG